MKTITLPLKLKWNKKTKTKKNVLGIELLQLLLHFYGSPFSIGSFDFSFLGIEKLLHRTFAENRRLSLIFSFLFIFSVWIYNAKSEYTVVCLYVCCMMAIICLSRDTWMISRVLDFGRTAHCGLSMQVCFGWRHGSLEGYLLEYFLNGIDFATYDVCYENRLQGISVVRHRSIMSPTDGKKPISNTRYTLKLPIKFSKLFVHNPNEDIRN